MSPFWHMSEYRSYFVLPYFTNMKCKYYFRTNIQHINEFRMYARLYVCICMCMCFRIWMLTLALLSFVLLFTLIPLYCFLAAVIRCLFIQLWFLVRGVLITVGDSDTNSNNNTDQSGLAGISNFALLHQLVAFGVRRSQMKSLLALIHTYIPLC